MSDTPACPTCGSEYTYNDGVMNICSICAYEWNDASLVGDENSDTIRDANGNILSDGDSVILIKDLKVKGASNPIKQGTLVKNISLVNEAGHNISCKVSGFGDMYLKSEFVKKA